MKPETVAGQKAKLYCSAANISLPMLGLSTWDDRNGFKDIQAELDEYTGMIDGLFYSKSARAFAEHYQHHLIVDDQFVDVGDIELVNYLNGNCHRFKAKRRREPTEIVVHESVTQAGRGLLGWQRTVNILIRRHLGVHLIVHEDGTVTQHADLYDRMIHAGPHNSHSIGLECQNIYYHHLAPEKPWISARWAHKRKYVLPSEPILVTVPKLITAICGTVPTIPLEFAGAKGDGTVYMSRYPDKKPRPGIWAHSGFGHADGSYIVSKVKEVLDEVDS